MSKAGFWLRARLVGHGSGGSTSAKRWFSEMCLGVINSNSGRIQCDDCGLAVELRDRLPRFHAIGAMGPLAPGRNLSLRHCLHFSLLDNQRLMTRATLNHKHLHGSLENAGVRPPLPVPDTWLD